MDNVGIAHFDLSFLTEVCSQGPGPSLSLVNGFILGFRQVSMCLKTDGQELRNTVCTNSSEGRNHKSFTEEAGSQHTCHVDRGAEKVMDNKLEPWGRVVAQRIRKTGDVFHHWFHSVSEDIRRGHINLCGAGKLRWWWWQKETTTVTRVEARKARSQHQPGRGAIVTVSFWKIRGIICRFSKKQMWASLQTFCVGAIIMILFLTPQVFCGQELLFILKDLKHSHFKHSHSFYQLLYVIMSKYLYVKLWIPC